EVPAEPASGTDTGAFADADAVPADAWPPAVWPADCAWASWPEPPWLGALVAWVASCTVLLAAVTVAAAAATGAFTAAATGAFTAAATGAFTAADAAADAVDVTVPAALTAVPDAVVSVW